MPSSLARSWVMTPAVVDMIRSPKSWAEPRLELLDIRHFDGVPGLDHTAVVYGPVQHDAELACLSVLDVLELADVAAVLHDLQHTADQFG